MSTNQVTRPTPESQEPLGDRAGNERGVALIMVIACLAIIFPFMAEFSYKARVDWQGAVNQGDEIRARNVERGAMRISVLMFELQRTLFNGKARGQVGSFDITQFAGYLMSIFGTQDGAKGLGAMAGLNVSGLPDLSLGEGYSFEMRLMAEGGRVNVNCLADTSGKARKRQQAARAIYSVMAPSIYNPLFEEEKSDGRRYRRDEVLASIVDYVDTDRERFDVQTFQSSSAGESSDYTQLYDPYQARNARLDSVAELHLVQGVDDDWMTAFGPSLTVYGDCKVNLNFASAEMIANVIAATAQPQERYKVEGENYARYAQRMANFIVQNREMNLFRDLKSFVDMVANPRAQASPFAMMNAANNEDMDDQLRQLNQQLPEPILLNFTPPKKGSKRRGQRRPAEPSPSEGLDSDTTTLSVGDVATVDPERTYRVEITTEVGSVRKKMTAVYGMEYVRTRTRGKGAWLHLRAE